MGPESVEYRRLRDALGDVEARADDMEAELTAARGALSRYADHDRECEARENSLYACTCGFVAMIERIFPVIRSATGTETTE